MHSSQMYTPGPAMSFLTCFWLFPQNEHFSRSESPNFAITPLSSTIGTTGLIRARPTEDLTPRRRPPPQARPGSRGS